MEMQSTASLLIFSNWNTSLQKGGITGKLFEYLTSGVPIVGVSSGDSPNSEAKKIIEKSGAGFCYEEASDLMDYPRLIDFVRESYTQLTIAALCYTVPRSTATALHGRLPHPNNLNCHAPRKGRFLFRHNSDGHKSAHRTIARKEEKWSSTEKYFGKGRWG